MSTMNELNELEMVMLGPSFDVTGDEKIAVKAEDVQAGNTIDYSKHYFEPKPGETYLVKFLPNPGGDLIMNRRLYKNLPDPERTGKAFHYISSGVASSCKALELFFELNSKAKEGDAVAKQKIDKYLGCTNQGCVKVQILQSPNKEEVGAIRLFVYSTFGPNATIANLINQKLNPTKEQLEQGYEREDIFNIFESSVLSVVCTESVYDGKKGRAYDKSSWAPKKRGAIVTMPDGTSREFVAKDFAGAGKLVPEIVPYFKEFVAQLTSPDYDMYKYFAYKNPNDGRFHTLDDDTKKYIENVFKKVEEIVPIIRDCKLSEIATYNKSKTSDSSSGQTKNILEESIPEELKSVVNNRSDAKPDEKPSPSVPVDNDVAAILNS